MQDAEFERNLAKYAEVLVKIGLNLRPGQRLLMYGRGGVTLEAAPLVRAVTLKAYQAGARYVEVVWADPQVKLIRFQHAPRDSFQETSTLWVNTAIDYGQHGDALFTISGDDPDLLAGQDPELVAQSQRAADGYIKPFLDIIDKNGTNWLVAGAAVPAWSAKVLPDVPPAEREARMWDLIFEMCRIKQEHPVAGWQEHIRRLRARATYLDHKRYRALKYTAPGTDLTIGLPDGHLWQSGSEISENGIEFTANIPTEEVFTMPHRAKVDGVITASKPLNLGGMLVDNFSLTFEGGKAVNAVAGKGEASLRRLIDADEGARHLGEVALVPQDSPIAQCGVLFYNTLFDENASNHIALGSAYRTNVERGQEMSESEFEAAGGNQSVIHVDFMVGSDQMDIDGVTANGSVEPVMRSGKWAFDV